jgi:hypothetical protein
MNARNMILCLAFLATGFSASLYADSLDFGKKISYLDNNPSADYNPLFAVNTGIMANTKDAFLSIGFGLMIVPHYSISLQIGGYIRLFDKTVFVEKKSNWLYQYKEERFVIVLTADMPVFVPDTGFAFFAGGGVGYTAANYKGTSQQADNKGTPVVKCGIQYGKRWFGRIGYQYMKIPHVPMNWGTAEFGFIY